MNVVTRENHLMCLTADLIFHFATVRGSKGSFFVFVFISGICSMFKLSLLPALHPFSSTRVFSHHRINLLFTVNVEKRSWQTFSNYKANSIDSLCNSIWHIAIKYLKFIALWCVQTDLFELKLIKQSNRSTIISLSLIDLFNNPILMFEWSRELRTCQ